MSEVRKNPRRHHIDQLTWLRGIAAFFVIISHSILASRVQYRPEETPADFSSLYFFNLGSFGVTLFFVLSGCTIYLSNRQPGSPSGVFRFYVKRIFRVWPAFAVSIFVYILFLMFFQAYYIEPKGAWIEQFLNDYTITDIFKYLSLTFNLTGPPRLFNSAYWSLPVEFQYYFLYPLIVYTLFKIGIAGPVIIGLLMYLVQMTKPIDVNRYEVFWFGYTFCMGVVIGYLYERIKFRFSLEGGLALLALCFIIISFHRGGLILVAEDIPIVRERLHWYGVFSILSVFIILFTDFGNPKNWLTDFLKYYGEISYSTYLYHNIFVGFMVLFFLNYGIDDAYQRFALTLSFSLVTSYIAASISYELVEKPFVQFSRKLVN